MKTEYIFGGIMVVLIILGLVATVMVILPEASLNWDDANNFPEQKIVKEQPKEVSCIQQCSIDHENDPDAAKACWRDCL
jgi:hypothetical protein